MILQPLIENCFKHGFEGAEQAEIGIVVEVSGDTLSITVSDNGPGVTPERLLELERQIAGEQPGGTEGDSIGLMNVVSRLRLFFNDQADVILGHAEPHGFNVQIRIPLTEGA